MRISSCEHPVRPTTSGGQVQAELSTPALTDNSEAQSITLSPGNPGCTNHNRNQHHTPSTECKSVWKHHAHLPDTSVNLTCASIFFQLLPGPPWTEEMCSQTPHEQCQMLLEAPAVIEMHSGWSNIWPIRQSNSGTAQTSAQVCRRLWGETETSDPALQETSREAQTSAQLGGRLGAVFSQQCILGFHKVKAFHLSYSSLLVTRFPASQYGMYYLSNALCIYRYSQSRCRQYSREIGGAPWDPIWTSLEMHLEAIMAGKSISNHLGNSVSQWLAERWHMELQG